MMHEINGLEIPIFDLDNESRKLARCLSEIGNAYGKSSVTYKKAAGVVDLSLRFIESINEKNQQIASGSDRVFRGDKKIIIEAASRQNGRNAIASLTMIQARYQEEMSRHCQPENMIPESVIPLLDDLIEAGVLRTGKKYPGADASDLAVTLFKMPGPLVEKMGYDHKDPQLMKQAAPRGAEAIDQAARILKIVKYCIARFGDISKFSYKGEATKERDRIRSAKRRAASKEATL